MQQHLLEITVDCLQRPLLEVASFWNRELSMRDGGGGALTGRGQCTLHPDIFARYQIGDESKTWRTAPKEPI